MVNVESCPFCDEKEIHVAYDDGWILNAVLNCGVIVGHATRKDLRHQRKGRL